MINLDDKKALIKNQGGTNVLKSIDALPGQLRQAFQDAQRIKLPEEYRQVKKILVCGMGGSRFPSLIIRELFKSELPVPYEINDDYILPGFVDKDTLVILSSYSGTTEEPVSVAKQALQIDAKVFVITSNADSAVYFKEKNCPVYAFDPVLNPSGQPRIGFGYTVGGHLGLLVNLGFLKEQKTAIEKALSKMDSLINDFKIDVPSTKNPVKTLAQKLFQKYPYYIVSEFLNGVTNGIANQTNETAKSISSFRIIPELNHHLMEGLKFPDVLKKIAVFVFFASRLYSPQIQKRFKITKEIVEQNKIQTIWHELKGENKIEQAFELMALGGYLSMYLSALYEQDPTAIPYVDHFKSELKKMQ